MHHKLDGNPPHVLETFRIILHFYSGLFLYALNRLHLHRCLFMSFNCFNRFRRMVSNESVQA